MEFITCVLQFALFANQNCINLFYLNVYVLLTVDIKVMFSAGGGKLYFFITSSLLPMNSVTQRFALGEKVLGSIPGRTS